ncbi:MAG: IS21 family transposase [Candidatus Omnitrophica bacterium]|nr:IS21 family transposase [Candidatus Omnitrophota bacterium]
MANERITLRKIRLILKLYYESKLSARAISRSCLVSRDTIQEYIRRFESSGLDLKDIETRNEDEIYQILFSVSDRNKLKEKYHGIDFEYYYKEMKKVHVTRQLLWEEYKSENPEGLGRSQFCYWFKEWEKDLDVTMRQHHKAGEKCFVDYCDGPIIPDESGNEQPTSIFVIVWGASNYTYAEATFSKNLADWIGSHVRAFNYFGCVPHILVPDNLKSGVKSSNYYEPEINQTYADFADHYGMVVIPARPGRAKDKAIVEAGVKITQQRILAALRNIIYTNLRDLNQDIRKYLDNLNTQPMQKINQSRKDLFDQLDRPNGLKLPDLRYEYAFWKRATVFRDYHIELEGNYYSVPYTYVRKKVEARITSQMVEIFYHGDRIASHIRSYGKRVFTTEKLHMPKSHQKYQERTPEDLIQRGNNLGESIGLLIQSIFSELRVIEQGYQRCLGILSLEKEYGQERLNQACKRALTYHGYSYRVVREILEKGLDLIEEKNQMDSVPEINILHENIRGKNYYYHVS